MRRHNKRNRVDIIGNLEHVHIISIKNMVKKTKINQNQKPSLPVGSFLKDFFRCHFI